MLGAPFAIKLVATFDRVVSAATDPLESTTHWNQHRRISSLARIPMLAGLVGPNVWKQSTMGFEAH
jgi:hypothetical protein